MSFVFQDQDHALIQVIVPEFKPVFHGCEIIDVKVLWALINQLSTLWILLVPGCEISGTSRLS